MTTTDEKNNGTAAVREPPSADARPQTVLERQETITGYFIRRAKRRRELFLRRSATSSLRRELTRNLFLAGCLFLDFLVIPEALFLLPYPWGWVVTLSAIAIVVWLEVRFYQDHFSLPGPQERPP